MRRPYLNAVWINEMSLPKAKKIIKNQGNIVRNKERSARLLCNIKPLVWQRMLYNLCTGEEKTDDNRNVDLQKGDEITIDRARKK